MRVEWVVVSLTLLTPAIAGCQATLPVRSSSASGWQDVSRAAAASPFQSPAAAETTGDDKTTHTLSEEREPLVASTQHSDQETLTLADLEGIAFENNPTLSAAVARVDAARGMQVQSRLYPNPVIGYRGTEIGNQGTAGQQGGFISQRFITGGKLRLDQAIAGMDVDERHFRFHAQQQRVLSDVRVRFYNALVAQRRLTLTRDLARISDNLLVATQKLLDEGQTTENTLLQSEIETEETHVLFDNAQNENVEAWRRLSAIVGVPTMRMTPLTGDLDADLPSYTWEDCYASVFERHPQLAAARTQVERSRIAITRARKEVIPNIDLLVSVRHINPTDSDTASVMAGIPIPIFDKNQGNIMRAQAEMVSAQNEVRRIELDLQDRLAVAYRRYANARQQAQRYSLQILPRARESLELVTNGYENGQVKYLTLINSQQKFVRVNLTYLNSVQQLWEAATLIEGQLLSESLSDRR